ncbi:division/cell wall cluster transcriptional repressor MraZ [Ruminococcaceae bacterium OttesenSCG-928-D13]|nr:division/cell wall cluster transcriptional repressor MraZ [Ruminococcaceae bacterium OttesenSCG-928-D13]
MGNSLADGPRKGEKAVLMGEHRCALDDKGRLNFPARFRDEMGESFIITRWLDDCIVAFPQTEWDRVRGLLREKNIVKTRDVRRFLYAGASEAAPDKQGRILVPAPLREHARLQKDVVVVGVDWYAEIWDADAWHGMTARLDSGAIAAAMEELEL